MRGGVREGRREGRGGERGGEEKVGGRGGRKRKLAGRVLLKWHGESRWSHFGGGCASSASLSLLSFSFLNSISKMRVALAGIRPAAP